MLWRTTPREMDVKLSLAKSCLQLLGIDHSGERNLELERLPSVLDHLEQELIVHLTQIEVLETFYPFHGQQDIETIFRLQQFPMEPLDRPQHMDGFERPGCMLQRGPRSRKHALMSEGNFCQLRILGPEALVRSDAEPTTNSHPPQLTCHFSEGGLEFDRDLTGTRFGVHWA